ncbi:MAG: glycosyltransferase family 4 protein [Gaiella sp.]
MRVVFDVSSLEQTRAGTARHVRGLLAAIERRAEPDLEITRVSCEGAGKLATVRRDGWWYPFRLSGKGADVLHCPTFRSPRRPGAPLVVTVHDAALLRMPDAFPLWHRVTGRRALTAGVRRADAVVAVSEFTKRELIDLTGVPPERIRVVPNGLDPAFSGGARSASPPGERRYALTVATLEPRKNLAAAVAAAEHAGIPLRVAGAAGWGGVTTSGWVGNPSDTELVELFRGASCLVYPSLYEGFGLPVLEAMALGVPVVTSRGGATEEVAGGAAVLVDPHDVESIAAGIAEALERREELVARGLERAPTFTWDAAAGAVVELWRELT